MNSARNSAARKKAIDVAFIVALDEEVEVSDFLSEPGWEEYENHLGLEIFTKELSIDSGQKVSSAMLHLGDQGIQKAAIVTTKFIQLFEPKLLTLVGISGRISNDCMLGDVIVASSCDDPFYRTKLQGGKPIPGGKEFQLGNLTKILHQKLKKSPPLYSNRDINPRIFDQLKELKLMGSTTRMHIGPICSSQFLVDDSVFSDWLKMNRNRNILAADMESSAVIQAAYESGIRGERMLVVRGVSDPADGSKKNIDEINSGLIRQIAMNNATQLLRHSIYYLLNFSDKKISLLPDYGQRDQLNKEFLAVKESIEILKEIPNLVACDKSIKEICENTELKFNKSNSKKRQLAELALSAYKIEIDQEDDTRYELISSLEQEIRDYLVAYNVMNSTFKKNNNQELILLLSNVYPYRINRFCRAMLQCYKDERKLVNTLISVYAMSSSKQGKHLKNNARAHICYLLGRVGTPQQKKKAIDHLTKWRFELVKRKSTKKPFDLTAEFSLLKTSESRLLLRTICISLIVLNRATESDNYVHACIRNKEFDSLNRGFHLEYYGDIDYDASEDMYNIDTIKCSIDNTFDTLFLRISTSIATNQGYPTRDVELQTLLSLCQKRLANSNLDREIHTKLFKWLSQQSLQNLTNNKLLLEYSKMILDHLSEKSFRADSVIRKLFELKKMHRSGWNDNHKAHSRYTENPESVLSHTAGGAILIQFLLPEKLSETDIEMIGAEEAKAYSKTEILNMFLIHDLAEAYIGDLLPRQRNEVIKMKERDVYSKLDLLSSYPGIEYIELYRLWEEFENHTTINGKIAREFDHIDNIFQLTIEKNNQTSKISDYESWMADLAQRIVTPVSKRALEILLGEYNNLGYST